jgi:hypothetical protein
MRVLPPADLVPVSDVPVVEIPDCPTARMLVDLVLSPAEATLAAIEDDAHE